MYANVALCVLTVGLLTVFFFYLKERDRRQSSEKRAAELEEKDKARDEKDKARDEKEKAEHARQEEFYRSRIKEREREIGQRDEQLRVMTAKLHELELVERACLIIQLLSLMECAKQKEIFFREQLRACKENGEQMANAAYERGRAEVRKSLKVSGKPDIVPRWNGLRRDFLYGIKVCIEGDCVYETVQFQTTDHCAPFSWSPVLDIAGLGASVASLTA